jgi:RNA 3'-terminal phosphate cyclase (ATP)
MCTGKPFVLHRIRAGRAKPGLMRQHLTCVNAAAAVCGATVEGAELGSSSLTFSPGPVRAGEYTFKVGTAGSCTLVLQTVWPALMLADAPSQLRLGGGTHNPMAPPFHFLERCFAPLLAKLGAASTLKLRRLGFYPAGGGEMDARIEPAREALMPFDLCERGPLREAFAECFAPALPRAVARRELESLRSQLGWQDEQFREGASRQNEGPGNAMLATLVHEHVSEVITAFGEKGVSAEGVAKAVAREVQAYQASEAALGPHLADQWALPLALAAWLRQRGASYTCTELTLHATTNFAVIERFLPVVFHTEGADGGWRVQVTPQ